MHRIAKFHFVSPSQFLTAMQEEYPQYTEEQIKEMYEALKLPKRATKGSAGYDFFAPFTFKLTPGETIKIPTGIRAEMQEDWVLQIYPRSGLGFKYRLQMNNTVGIIDSDYFFSDNEGHIFMKSRRFQKASPLRSRRNRVRPGDLHAVRYYRGR